jgi:prolyl 4-hydroxylase
MTTTSIAKSAGFWAGGLLLGLSIPHLNLPTLSSPGLASFIGDFPIPDYPFALPFFKNQTITTTTTTSVTSPPETPPFVCDTTHTYRTELVSLDPLIIYIHNIITPLEIISLLSTAEPKFAPSQVTKHGRKQQTTDRTSSSAGLPRDDPTVKCVLDRARTFLGTMMRDGWDEMGPPQLVRYSEGQKFNVHHDWYEYPQWAPDGSTRKWNRVASFFAILEDDCTGGETHFPYVQGITKPSPYGEVMWRGGVRRAEGEREEEVRPLWREHEEGGLAFRPVAGNAVFWVNLHANETGDPRTRHAGLPLESGRKTAMNIWPRRYYPYE